ncbi:C4-dicarboxylate ABC transporter permease [Opitutaceae bacterium TAV5]|nr:C4-dicarboxylate ABC transporter permease [Opitutaceae bacterium TAV5]
MSSFFLYSLKKYVRAVNAVNRVVGYFAMYLLVFMLAILTWSVISNGVLNSPAIWVMEMAQFSMAAYYLLGAGFSMQQGAHVRMDIFYERWSPRRRAGVDSFTILLVIFYLVVLVMGGYESSYYALEYGQRNHTVWRPYMAPIKIIMTLGMLLMLLQAVAELIKNVAAALGKELS